MEKESEEIMDRDEEMLDGTLGDLIMALNDEALRFAHNEREASAVLAYILSDLWRNSEPLSKCWH